MRKTLAERDKELSLMQHLAELRNMVTSPGGTSAAAIYELEKGTMRTVLSRAVYAAYRRTRELGVEAEERSRREKP